MMERKNLLCFLVLQILALLLMCTRSIFPNSMQKMGSHLKDTLFVAAAQIYDAPSMTADEFLDTIHAIGADCNIDRSSIGENSAFVQSLTFNPKKYADCPLYRTCSAVRRCDSDIRYFLYLHH